VSSSMASGTAVAVGVTAAALAMVAEDDAGGTAGAGVISATAVATGGVAVVVVVVVVVAAAGGDACTGPASSSASIASDAGTCPFACAASVDIATSVAAAAAAADDDEEEEEEEEAAAEDGDEVGSLEVFRADVLLCGLVGLVGLEMFLGGNTAACAASSAKWASKVPAS
jgi:hypothetical protein